MSEREEHLTEQVLEAYLNGTLSSAEEYLAVDAHLAACAACGSRLQQLAGPPSAELSALKELVLHPDYRRIEAYAQGGEAAVSARVAAHCRECPECAEEVADLRELWALPNASATGTQERLRDTCGLWVRALERPLTPPLALPDELARKVERLLETRRFPRIPGRPDLRLATPGTMQDAGNSPAPARSVIVLVSPVGTVVMEARPVLRWLRAAESRDYRVMILDEETEEEVAVSPLLQPSEDMEQMEWTPPDPLPRAGREHSGVYVWSVSARGEDGMPIYPDPRAPRPLFQVLEAELLEELKATTERYRDSYLVKALLYSEHGLTEAAAQELEALASANPGSDLAAELLAALGLGSESRPSGSQPPSPIST